MGSGGKGRQISQRSYAGQEEISATSYGRKGRQALDLRPNRPFGNGHVISAVLRPKDRVALVAQLMKVWIVHPHIHCELKLAHQARATDKGGNASFLPIIGCTLRQGRTV